jgi:hypothetical protein
VNRLAALLLVLAAGCEPDLAGRCAQGSDCSTQSVCTATGVCISSTATGSCRPTCGAGELCADSACAALMPGVTVRLSNNPTLTPQNDRVPVRIVASSSLNLGALSVEVRSDHLVASGSIPKAVADDQNVTLTQFESGAKGAVSVTATLSFTQAGSSAAQTVQSGPAPAQVSSAAAPPAAATACGAGGCR